MQHPFQQQMLQEIRVEAQVSGQWQLIRRYVLTYENNTTNRIFPGVAWDYNDTPGNPNDDFQGNPTLVQSSATARPAVRCRPTPSPTRTTTWRRPAMATAVR